MSASLFRWFWFLSGLLVLSSTVLLYEDEERRLRNKLVDWWVSVSRTGELAVSKQVALARGIALAAGKLTTRVMGPRYLSLRVAWVSFCFGWLWEIVRSLITIFVVGMKWVPINTLFFPVFVIGWGGGALLPMLRERQRWTPWPLVIQACLCVCLLAQVANMFVAHQPGFLTSLAVLPVQIASACISRYLLERIGRNDRHTLLLCGALTATPLVVAAGAFGLMTLRERIWQTFPAASPTLFLAFTQVSFQIGTIAMTPISLCIVVGCASFLIVFLLNVSVWFVLSRLLNAAYSRFPDRKWMVGLSMFCFAAWATSFTHAAGKLLGVGH